jgi:hypothetical protein
MSTISQRISRRALLQSGGVADLRARVLTDPQRLERGLDRG